MAVAHSKLVVPLPPHGRINLDIFVSTGILWYLPDHDPGF